MVDNKKNKFNKDNPDRERFSNFVVDLRPTGRLVLEKRIKRRNDRGVNLNFKLSIARERLGSVFSSFRSPFPNFFRNLFRRAPKNRWREFFREQERIFRAAPRFKGRPFFKTPAAKIVPWYHSSFSFILVLFLLIASLKFLSYFELLDWRAWEGKIVGKSQSALDSLMSAAASAAKLDFQGADLNFRSAGESFLSAQSDLNKINDSLLSLAALSDNPQIKLAAESKKFLAAGASASSLGGNLVLATDSLFNGDKNDFRGTLDNFLTYGHAAVKDIRELEQIVKKINSANLPDNYRDKFEFLNKQVVLLAENLDNFVTTGDKLKEILGLSRDKRYLLVFQNNAELRASGGFLGSYALVDLRDGKIRNLEVPGGGSYDTEAGLSVLVAAPRPLWLVNPLWHFWDANWWPDWPTTARNLMWFYEKSDGPSVDGVISVTPTVIERLLEITGPIDLSAEYGLIINADNFWETVQKVTERENLAKTNPEAVAVLPATSTPVAATVPLKQGLEVNAANKPKKIIGDLLAKILEVLPQKLTKENLLKIITLFEENMTEKQILLYFTDPTLQAEVAKLNWAGEIKDTAKDYLSVVNTNIAGQKSDREISEKIEITSEVGSDGVIVNTLTIALTHNGIKNTPLTGVRNVDWLRVYVPLGSELLSATGFQSPDEKYLQARPEESWEDNPLLAAENSAVTDPTSGTKIYPENNKTVFANWTLVDPGETTVIVLRYRLPFNFWSKPADESGWKRLNNWFNPDATELWPHSLLVQKQPGAKASEFSGHLILPDDWRIFWRYPENLNGTGGWDITAQINSDKYYSILTGKNEPIK
ncbi:MAG: DUF4012 domain-containing protein [Patescibacteria group bacterium]